jgi:regulator of nucleoside diphosphate kinase
MEVWKGKRVQERKLFISKFDKERLESLIMRAIEGGHENKGALKALGTELKKAKIVNSKNIPANIVTMNSKIVLKDVNTAKEMTYTLVFPDGSQTESGTLSILAPIGTAILGYGEGDIIEWPVPSGVRKIQIEKILYQPEAAGDFHL